VPTWLIFILLGIPVLLVVIWIVLLETSVQVAPGTIGLVLLRGRTTGRVLTPGRHFMSPFRRAMLATYPSREVTYLATLDWSARTASSDIERFDPPLPVRLGDRTACRMSYTVRFRIEQLHLPLVHDRFGPEGVWAVVRDESRRTLITQLGDASVTSDDVTAPKWFELEAKLTEAMQATLAVVGLEMTFFSLVDSGLGEAGEVVQAAVRARLAVARRQAEGLVADTTATARTLPEDVLRYRQFEVWRELIARWNGRTPLPIGLAPELQAALPVPHQGEARVQEEGA
jgi:regulator of protease activity HflC (stomatin/prohibitin superfamily)